MTTLTRPELDDRALWATILRLSRMTDGELLASLSGVGRFTDVAQALTADTPKTAMSVVLDHTTFTQDQATDLVTTWWQNLAKIGGLVAGVDDLEKAHRIGGRLITSNDEEWPTHLTPVPSLCGLWAIGPAHLDQVLLPSVTLTGSRASTSYGNHVASELTQHLVRAGVTVVAPVGYGIPEAALRAVLATQGRHDQPRAVAVMASGLDRFSRETNAPLLEELAKDHLVVSEEAPGSVATLTRSRRRSLVTAGLSKASVIVEAGLRSGSRLVAQHALEMGRPVGAVPGPITSTSSDGTHQLIKDDLVGLITNVDDVLALLTAWNTRWES